MALTSASCWPCTITKLLLCLATASAGSEHTRCFSGVPNIWDGSARGTFICQAHCAGPCSEVFGTGQQKLSIYSE